MEKPKEAKKGEFCSNLVLCIDSLHQFGDAFFARKKDSKSGKRRDGTGLVIFYPQLGVAQRPNFRGLLVCKLLIRLHIGYVSFV
jgi:hypothetical protein